MNGEEPQSSRSKRRTASSESGAAARHTKRSLHDTYAN